MSSQPRDILEILSSHPLLGSNIYLKKQSYKSQWAKMAKHVSAFGELPVSQVPPQLPSAFKKQIFVSSVTSIYFAFIPYEF